MLVEQVQRAYDGVHVPARGGLGKGDEMIVVGLMPRVLEVDERPRDAPRCAGTSAARAPGSAGRENSSQTPCFAPVLAGGVAVGAVPAAQATTQLAACRMSPCWIQRAARWRSASVAVAWGSTRSTASATIRWKSA
jgi:hypothetical protein